MTNIYDQHDAAFKSVQAFVIVKDGEKIGKVAIKFPKDGANRLYAYVHIHGAPMVRAYAGGCGYDKSTAAVQEAISKVYTSSNPDKDTKEYNDLALAIQASMSKADRKGWGNALRDAGFTVFQAV